METSTGGCGSLVETSTPSVWKFGGSFVEVWWKFVVFGAIPLERCAKLQPETSIETSTKGVEVWWKLPLGGVEV